MTYIFDHRRRRPTSAHRASSGCWPGCALLTERDGSRLPARTIGGRSARSVASHVVVVSGAQQIPPIAGDVEEDRDAAVGFGARVTDEPHAGLRHLSVRRVEVIDTQEVSDSAGCLVTDGCSLPLSVCASKQETRLCRGRADDHPALGTTVAGERRRVLDEVESEYAGEERDGGVVLVND